MKCRNSCAEEAALARTAFEERLSVVKQAWHSKSQRMQEGQEAKIRRKQDIADLTTKIQILEKEVEELAGFIFVAFFLFSNFFLSPSFRSEAENRAGRVGGEKGGRGSAAGGLAKEGRELLPPGRRDHQLPGDCAADPDRRVRSQV